MSIAEKLITIAQNEQRVFNRGHYEGYSEGYNAGGKDAYSIGFGAGKTAEYDRFWNGYQQNGSRTNYAFAFRGRGWTDETYNPKYPIVAKSTLEMGFRESKITRLTNIETSGVTNFNTAFYNMAECTYIEKVDMSSATNTTSAFAHNPSLVTIGEIVSSETTVWHNQAFYSCAALENLIFTEDSIIATDFTCSNSSLSKASIMSIINALKNYSPEENVRTCTIGSSNLKKLTEDEKKIATRKGWELK